MTSLLTLDHTTLFFYTLCSQHHTTSVKHWRTSIDTKISPGSKGASTIPTAPSLIHTSNRSSTSKCQSAASDLVIDLCGPTPKQPRTQCPKTTTINLKVKVVVLDNDDDDLWGGRLSDEKEMDCPEAVAAHLSPLKNGAWATSSVSNIQLYTYYSHRVLFKSKLRTLQMLFVFISNTFPRPLFRHLNANIMLWAI